MALGTLRAAPVTPADLEEMRELDLSVSGVDRTADHAWLLNVGLEARMGLPA